MARIVVIGGGFGGLTTALLLARSGQDVTVLERDPAAPGDPGGAFDDWERRGVPQFRLPHVFLPRLRELFDDELPDVNAAVIANGGRRTNRMATLPVELTGGLRPGDERFEQITGRRAMVEATLAGIAAAEQGVSVRRGVVVRGLVPGSCRPAGVPHVSGVVLATGERIAADLVVDCSGRRSSVPSMLEAMGAVRPVEELGDAGFVYYCRHFRRADGEQPALLGPPLQHYDTISFVTIPGDHGTWSVGLMANAGDGWMRHAASNVDMWSRIVRGFPLLAHWIDGDAITDVQVMARTPDRVRRYLVDGQPVATGIVAIGDASASTSPAFGRGATLATMEAHCLRDVLREVPTADACELSHRWHDRVGNVVYPFVAETLAAGRHRYAEIEAQLAGRPYRPADAMWAFERSLSRAAGRDPEVLRAMMSMVSVFVRRADLARQRDLLRRLDDLGDLPGLPGPTRRELEAAIGAAGDIAAGAVAAG